MILSFNTKFAVELGVLGNIITRHSYLQVSGILNSNHFGDWSQGSDLLPNNQLVWQTIVKHSAEPMDALTIADAIERSCGLKYSYQINKIVDAACTDVMLHRYCFMLLEHTITINYQQLLRNMIFGLSEESTLRGSLKEIYEALEEPDCDILETVDSSIAYLVTIMGQQDLINTLTDFRANIDARAVSIKSKNRFSWALTALLQSKTINENGAACIKTLVDLIAYASSVPVSKEFNKKLTELKQLAI